MLVRCQRAKAHCYKMDRGYASGKIAYSHRGFQQLNHSGYING